MPGRMYIVYSTDCDLAAVTSKKNNLQQLAVPDTSEKRAG